MYKIKVAGQVFSYTPIGTSVAESINTEFVEFVFDSAWDNLIKYACFKNSKVDKEYHILLNETNTCAVPWEVLAEPGLLYVGALGTNEEGAVVQPTIWVQISKVVDGVSPTGDISEEATPSAIMQVTTMAATALANSNKVAQSLATKAPIEKPKFVGGIEVDDAKLYLTEDGVFVIQIPMREDEQGMPINPASILSVGEELVFNGRTFYNSGNLKDLAQEGNVLVDHEINNFMVNTHLNETLGDIESALDGIIAMQNELIGGDA